MGDGGATTICCGLAGSARCTPRRGRRRLNWTGTGGINSWPSLRSGRRLGIRRHFTTPAVHPYDEVVWERRDARITNYRDGTVAFEQLGVEVPSSWSVNATNILSQKYFRGTLGTPEREWSLKQVADRVVDTIAAWGMKDGYFEDDAEAADLHCRTQAPHHPPEGRVQLAGLVQHRGQEAFPSRDRPASSSPSRTRWTRS